jgi:hypothetical protein
MRRQEQTNEPEKKKKPKLAAKRPIEPLPPRKPDRALKKM